MLIGSLASYPVSQSTGPAIKMHFPSLRNVIFYVVPVLSVMGCVRHNGSDIRGSNVQPFVPENADSYVIKKNQRFVIGEPVGQLQLPVYPGTLHVKEEEISVCLEVSIDERGIVSESRPLVAMPDCPARIEDVEPALISSARQAVREWRFAPSKLCTYPEGYDASSASLKCDGPVIRVELIPIRLAFRFRFTRKLTPNGKVSMDRLP
jgi:hypothetical protein